MPKYVDPSIRLQVPFPLRQAQGQGPSGIAQDDKNIVVNSVVKQSAAAIRNSARVRRFFLIFGKGLRSRWQSRQSDRAERRRRSSEFSGALHSSQRGGPTRPLWSCAIEIPPGRTQTGEQTRQQSCLVKQAWFLRCSSNELCFDTLREPHHSAVEEDHGVQRSAPDGRAFPPKQ